MQLDSHYMRKGFDFWPTQSPDLNFIQHLNENMRSGDNNTKELRNELLNQWNQTGNDLMDCLIDSMIDVKQL
ncbi:hypothetical protein A0J61_00141 [Choanephora cucurbitarum]|uniref:Uncharacterized protein n=1 Tax=Choanephora cucurbitarum TaxID=101091 RepID=A0A1C7NS31_9FUNG|nr:hypothetical protein A0J61_00141 [Choanephora cucurbitarum]